ncbi:uncharacterized protein A1O5_08098 [Cladophialophora psammophila CBS 110553]|uniref:SnoaL-like domain-containing protein n=1 Tax=Cladophialophora psammophila CBS 110553 TaxID=1182543 RepID=W9WMP2_9EURO|nr:uncharacterized protein A1O5_08098 [Cladophialophora psammophila CBS 110553]EXJ69163.1 hypothetical protein A1O5_08098 [Cladophialophora psammophila CBS 110553]
MSAWKTDTSLTSVDDLHGTLPGGPSKYHNPKLKHVEEEVLEHYKAFARFCNYECLEDPHSGKRFWDLDDMTIFDLMGLTNRPNFRPHYDKVTLYLKDAQIEFKDLEIVAVSETFAYATSLERYWGKAADGNDFDLIFRITSLMQKTSEGWQYVHEHYSFSVDLATKLADLSSGIAVDEGLALKK